MMRILRYLIVVVVAMLPGMLMAAPVDAITASEVAARFVTSGNAASLRSCHAPLRLVHTAISASKPIVADYYVFNAVDGSGFVIVAGDDRARQVLAYGDHAIDMASVPDNVQWLLDQYAEQMEYLFAHPGMVPSRSAINDSTTIVPQLMTTLWGQRTPYRNQCPQVDGKPCVTGCIATAMAQVMNYWHHPEVLPALPGYTTSTLRLQVPALPAATVSWDLMLDKYREGYYTQEEGEAVALLMRYCGQVSKMDYTIASSAATCNDQLMGLKTFGYEKTATDLSRMNFSDDEWHALLQEDLVAGRPVIYSGKSVTTAHSFVLDGFDGSKYHVNWGWDGTFDGYYELDAMDGGGYRPSNAHQMLHGVCPATEDYDCDYKVDGIYYNQKTLTTVAVTYRDKQYNCYSGEVVIPDTLSFNGASFRVTAITENAFRNCDQLTKVHIPNSVSEIGTRAFSHSGVDSIIIPDQVKTIGSLVFEYCPNLCHVEMGNHVKKINNGAFNNCTKLAAINLPDSLTTISEMAFYANGLESIVFPPRLVRIEDNAFGACKSLTAVHVKDIETWSKLRFTKINANPLTMAHYLYINGEKMTEIVIPESVDILRDYAFCGLAVDHMTINAGTLHAINTYTFYNSSIEQLDIQDAEAWCGITLHDAESNPMRHASHVYLDGQDLNDAQLMIPETVSAIGDYTFTGLKINGLTIPRNITSIGHGAFSDCDELNAVTCQSMTPPGTQSCFSTSFYSNATLYVPRQAVNAYSSAEEWKKFEHIVGIDMDLINGDVNGDGNLDIDDLTFIIQAILEGGDAPSLDVNGDGQNDIDDIICMIDILLSRAY